MIQGADLSELDSDAASVPRHRGRFVSGPRAALTGLAVFGIAAGFVAPGSAPRFETTSLCGEHGAPLAKVIDNAVADGNLVSAGLPQARRSNRVADYFAVDDDYWRQLAESRRALLAFAAYCRTGHGTDRGIVVIEGMQGGTPLAAIVDGEYIENPDRLSRLL
jgi:hypothetical protein